MNASEVRQTSTDVSKTVIDAAGGIASKAQEGAAAALAGARATADEVAARMPGIASAGAEGAAGSVRMLQELSDPRLELLVAFSLGVGAGLWMAGAPRLVTIAALSPALLAGVAIASRKQSHQGRGQRR
ncbi:MAG: hypothetical protein ABSA21_11850 [Candidatus Limnocylindrales bacterium]|jgi:hypothetical protein